MTLDKLNSLYNSNREISLKGRYIHRENILPLFSKISDSCDIEHIGFSVQGSPIESVTIGNGLKKILIWSQMHGNESTSTKSVFDLLNVLTSSDKSMNLLLSGFTIKVIPILNPDGAKAYKRVNANGVDLNRDAQELSQPESRVLKSVFEEFKPDFCFNLHGQRTIFSAGKSNAPATLSFLAPAQDKDCSITPNRKKAMLIISSINNVLQHEIPNQIGIYDDAFNINCVGDTFQSRGIPTLLFEAGHYVNDYSREEVRRFFFIALIEAMKAIEMQEVDAWLLESYFNIPKNEKLFYDIVFRNVVLSDQNQKLTDVAIQFKESLINNKIHFVPTIDFIGDLTMYYGHKEIHGNNSYLTTIDNQKLTVGYENDFVLFKNELFSIKP